MKREIQPKDLAESAGFDGRTVSRMGVRRFPPRVQIATQTGGRHVHLLSVRAMLGMRLEAIRPIAAAKVGSP